MTLKDGISLDKQNLPPYIFGYNVALVCFIIGWFVICLPVTVTVGVIYDESPITYGVMIGAFALFFIGLAAFAAAFPKLRRRLVQDRSAELEERFADMPQDKAEEILKQNGIISDDGFTVDDEVFGSNTISFENAVLTFAADVFHSRITVIVGIWAGKENLTFDSELSLAAVREMDGALFNFIVKRGLAESDNEFLNLLIKDKKTFCSLAIKNKI